VNRRYWLARLATDAAGHDIPAQGAADEEKDPGSAFGPKSIPLATGLVSVVYWVPGPFPGPTPVQPDERRSPFGATPSHEGGWMRAPSP
jgi:hypothetical protein